MGSHLNLVKTSGVQKEKRSFPRFSLPTMTFKSQNSPAVFQVVNFSSTGMLVQLKNGDHSWIKDATTEGVLCWKGNKISVEGKVVWADEHNIGLQFHRPPDLSSFLNPENILKGLKALHLPPFNENQPQQLRCWLQASLILDIFVWTQDDRHFQKFQTLFLEDFIEWKEEVGLATGKLSAEHRPTDSDCPEDIRDWNRFSVNFDQEIDLKKISPICNLIEKIPPEKIQESTREFMLMKLKAA